MLLTDKEIKIYMCIFTYIYIRMAKSNKIQCVEVIKRKNQLSIAVIVNLLS